MNNPPRQRHRRKLVADAGRLGTGEVGGIREEYAEHQARRAIAWARKEAGL